MQWFVSLLLYHCFSFVRCIDPHSSWFLHWHYQMIRLPQVLEITVKTGGELNRYLRTLKHGSDSHAHIFGGMYSYYLPKCLRNQNQHQVQTHKIFRLCTTRYVTRFFQQCETAPWTINTVHSRYIEVIFLRTTQQDTHSSPVTVVLSALSYYISSRYIESL